jgi:GntR family transcriptional regulator
MFSERIGRLDGDDHAPLYKQLQRALREAIQKKVLAPDDALPAERDMAEEFSISRITVRKALDGLVSEGLLTRRQGAGTFVAARVEKSFSKLSSFTEDMISRGRTPRSEWISKRRGLGHAGGVADPGPVARHAGLSLRPDPLCRRRADGRGIYDDRRLRPALGRGRRHLAVRGAGAPPVIAPCAPCSGCARCCSPPNRPTCWASPVKDAGLLIERRGFLKDGRAVEVTQSYYRGDAYDFVAELNALS